MITLYLLMVVVGIVLTIVLAARSRPGTIIAAAATLLAGFAVLSGFSIGIFVAPVAGVLLVIAASYVPTRRRDA